MGYFAKGKMGKMKNIVKLLKSGFQDVSLASILLYVFGVIYTLISIFHFGIFYPDTDKLISNLAEGFIIFFFGVVINRIEGLENAFKSEDGKVITLENKIIDLNKKNK